MKWAQGQGQKWSCPFLFISPENHSRKLGFSLLGMWISQFRREKFPLRALWQHSFVLKTGLGQFLSRGLRPPVIIDLVPHTLTSFCDGYAASCRVTS